MAEFDPNSGALTGKRVSSSEGEVFGARGYFVTLAGDDVVFYRMGAELRLWLRGRSWIASAATVTWQKVGNHSVMSAGDLEGQQVSITYEPLGAIEDDPTPFVEDEHWDFGLFVVNVLTEEGRASRILRG
ncbi:hypothetical protein [Phytomonospora endophytica]|uniref:Uncharacterized protein n=1 Tax=Phytomonospora endophytica TaxID=714109 RepID=A0A841FR90_9ACTN|nr:hypothetical protein [Phytomonospora endophytica]MBB6038566.1 hypothetical protein [Phytomonospora endophytica]